MSTNYPAALDDTTVLPNNRSDTTDQQANHAQDHNNISDAIRAIEGELGVLPKGVYVTVRARLDGVQGDLATHLTDTGAHAALFDAKVDRTEYIDWGNAGAARTIDLIPGQLKQRTLVNTADLVVTVNGMAEDTSWRLDVTQDATTPHSITFYDGVNHANDIVLPVPMVAGATFVVEAAIGADGVKPRIEVTSNAMPGGDLAGPGTTTFAPVIKDQAITPRKLDDKSRTGGWAPAGAITETIPRATYVSTAGVAVVAGTLYLYGGCLVPGGRTVTTITFVGGNAATVTGITNLWYCLVDPTTGTILAITADQGATSWTSGAVKGINLATPWTPTNAATPYVGIMQAGAAAALRASAAQVGVPNISIAPYLTATGGTGLTTPPAAGSTVAVAVNTALPNIAYAYLS